MKTWMVALAALLASPMMALAQDEAELKKDLQRKLAELEEHFNAQKRKIVQEFEQRMNKLRASKEKAKEHRPDAGGLEAVLDKIGRRLAELDERLSSLEKKLGTIKTEGADKKKDKEREEEEDKPKKKDPKKKDRDEDDDE